MGFCGIKGHLPLVSRPVLTVFKCLWSASTRLTLLPSINVLWLMRCLQHDLGCRILLSKNRVCQYVAADKTAHRCCQDKRLCIDCTGLLQIGVVQTSFYALEGLKYAWVSVIVWIWTVFWGLYVCDIQELCWFAPPRITFNVKNC